DGAAVNMRRPCSRLVAAWPLDLDDLSSEMSEMLGAERGGRVLAEFYDFYAGQRSLKRSGRDGQRLGLPSGNEVPYRSRAFAGSLDLRWSPPGRSRHAQRRARHIDVLTRHGIEQPMDHAAEVQVFLARISIDTSNR